MRFRLRCFSIRRSENIALFANPNIEGINPQDYQNPLDRYRNGKPIIRLYGPIAKNTMPIDRINEEFVKNPRQRKAISEKFNSSGGLKLDTKAKARTRRPIRVQRVNGLTFIRIQNTTVPEPTMPRPMSAGGRAALLSLAGVSGVAGAMYLVEKAGKRKQ